jgi:hypothetical protein
MADPLSLWNTRDALVTGLCKLFTEHYAALAAKMPANTRKRHLFEGSDAVDGLFEPIDRDHL